MFSVYIDPYGTYQILKKDIIFLNPIIKKRGGHLGGSVSWNSDFGSGNDLTVTEFEPQVQLTAVWALDPLSLSLCLSPLPQK